MDAEDPQLAWSRIDFEKCVTRKARVMPFEMANRLHAHEAEGLAARRRPLRHARPRRDFLNHRRCGGLLKNRNVRTDRGDHRGNLILLALAAAADVVAQYAERHVTPPLACRSAPSTADR